MDSRADTSLRPVIDRVLPLYPLNIPLSPRLCLDDYGPSSPDAGEKHVTGEVYVPGPRCPRCESLGLPSANCVNLHE